MDENNMLEKIKEILKESEKSSTEIASLLGRNYYDAIKILSEIDFIEKVEVGKFTFWRLKK